MFETKQCTKCKKELLISDFPKTGRSVCKKCVAKKTRDYYQKRNPDHRRDTYLKKMYGIGIKEYYEMLELQEGKCAICQSTDTGSKRFRYFSVDHDHNTGKIRGLLCKKCNIALGEMRDNPDIVYNAWMYLCCDQGKIDPPEIVEA